MATSSSRARVTSGDPPLSTQPCSMGTTPQRPRAMNSSARCVWYSGRWKADSRVTHSVARPAGRAGVRMGRRCREEGVYFRGEVACVCVWGGAGAEARAGMPHAEGGGRAVQSRRLPNAKKTQQEAGTGAARGHTPLHNSARRSTQIWPNTASGRGGTGAHPAGWWWSGRAGGSRGRT